MYWLHHFSFRRLLFHWASHHISEFHWLRFRIFSSLPDFHWYFRYSLAISISFSSIIVIHFHASIVRWHDWFLTAEENFSYRVWFHIFSSASSFHFAFSLISLWLFHCISRSFASLRLSFLHFSHFFCIWEFHRVSDLCNIDFLIAF